MYSLKDIHTFHCDVKANQIITIQSVADIQQLISQGFFLTSRWMLLGGGSNVLFLRDFDGVIIKNEIKGVHISNNEDGEVFLTAASGESWHHVVMYSIEQGLNGIENLALIPGTIGAAPMQNIGAYGVELKDVFHSLTAIEIATGQSRTFTGNECAFGYRESVFKHELKDKFIITSVTLRLRNDGVVNTQYGDIEKQLCEMSLTPPYTPEQVAAAVMQIRQSKLPDPNQLGNAGSFFKNPIILLSHFEQLFDKYPNMPHYKMGSEAVKIPAGWLIEQCGLKGYRMGDVGVHERQALVLVNYGNATGHEVIQMANTVINTVDQKYGIQLAPEVNIIQ